MQKIVSADYVFNGETMLPHHAVIIEKGRIVSVLPAVSLPDNIEICEHFHMLIPAFIDLQIYGAAGRLFSVYPTEETLKLMNEHCVAGGTALFQPTVATNDLKVFHDAIDAVRRYKKSGGKGVHGLHLEGPWINASKRGAHIESFIHAPTITEVKQLLEYGKDVVTMISLAPEICSTEIIELIQSYGIVISAGHSNATFTEATAAFEQGITTVTHLFNAMSGLDHRNPGLAAATMLDDSAMASIIADGYHVSFEMITLAKSVMKQRLFLITDAVTETTFGAYPHENAGDRFIANGILSGSALSMLSAVKKIIHRCNIKAEEAFRMAGYYPAKVLGVENVRGKIAQGFLPSMLALDENLNINNQDLVQ